jgi:hypothetical protein
MSRERLEGNGPSTIADPRTKREFAMVAPGIFREISWF